jgi:hypothetical protein
MLPSSKQLSFREYIKSARKRQSHKKGNQKIEKRQQKDMDLHAKYVYD